jgi:hypothetical protein
LQPVQCWLGLTPARYDRGVLRSMCRPALALHRGARRPNGLT